MSHGWPATIDPIQLAKRGAQLAGILPLKQMSRLAELCVDDQGEFDVELNFAHSVAEDLYEVHGSIRGTVGVICQRCLEPMMLRLSTDVRLTLLRPDERPDLLEDAEVLVVDKPTTVAAVVEDELLLAMPMIPMHPTSECPAATLVARRSEADTRRKPFAALAGTTAKRRPEKS